MAKRATKKRKKLVKAKKSRIKSPPKPSSRSEPPGSRETQLRNTNPAAMRDAERYIEDAIKNNATRVYLQSHLTELPRSLAKLTHLQELLISGNRLTVLPEFIGQLKELRIINVSNNELTAMPESLASAYPQLWRRLKGDHCFEQNHPASF